MGQGLGGASSPVLDLERWSSRECESERVLNPLEYALTWARKL